MAKRNYLLLVMLLGLVLTNSSLRADNEEITATLELSTGLGSTDLDNMAWDGTSLWVEGSGSLINLIGEGHNITDWLTYRQMEGFGRGSTAALWASGDTLLSSWIFNQLYMDEYIPAGDGLSISIDRGMTWRHISVVDMFPDRADYTYPGNYTTIWDIVVDSGTIWCSTTSGFLLKSEDFGENWENIHREKGEGYANLFNDPNYHGQCVDAYGDTVWVGTFQGMNLSVDGGETWTNFSWPIDGSGDPEADQWPGNFPVAVEHKVAGGKTHVWVASQTFGGLGRVGICHTSDNGATWEYKKYLDNESRPWNIEFGHSGVSDPAVGDSTVFVATDIGLLVSYDLGENWETWDTGIIRESDFSFFEPGLSVASSLVVGDTLWVTCSDGIARTTDWGLSWEVFKGPHRVKALDTGNRNIGLSSEYDYRNDKIRTYAFPNPFSPKRGDRDYSKTKIQYAIENDASVTIKIHDYSGRLIRELVSGVFRTGGRDYQEPWDGRDSSDSTVPNGVYFYIISTNKGDSARGKIMVLD